MYNDKDSSSDSDSESDTSTLENVVNVHSNVEDDEEESLEYFGDKVIHSKISSSATASIAIESDDRFIDDYLTMNRSSDGCQFRNAVESDFNVDIILPLDEHRQPHHDADTETITESEFEVEPGFTLNNVKTDTTLEPADDDDEFGVDSLSVEDQQGMNAIRRALESVASRSETECVSESSSLAANAFFSPNNVDFVSALPSASTSLYQPVEEPILASAADARPASAHQEARKAFREIADVYGSGLGDNEVLMLGVVEGASKTAAVPLDKSVAGLAIEEGDEDAEEQEELEQEVREAEVEAAASQLRTEWDEVGAAEALAGSKMGGLAKTAEFTTTASPALRNLSPVDVAPSKRSKVVSYKSALRAVQSSDLERFAPLIATKEEGRRGGWFGLGAPRDISYPQSEADLRLPFLAAQLDYDPSAHLDILTSIFSFFVSEESAAGVGATGEHWEKIGFQGVDPRTDLNRSMKMLSLLQVRAECAVCCDAQLSCLFAPSDAAPDRGPAPVRPPAARPVRERHCRTLAPSEQEPAACRSGQVVAVHVRVGHVHEGGPAGAARRRAQRKVQQEAVRAAHAARLPPQLLRGVLPVREP